MSALEHSIASLPAWLVILAIQVLVIVVPASLAYAGLYMWRGNPARRRKVQPEFAAPHHVRREVRFALLAALIFAVNGVLMLVFIYQGWTLVYDRIAEYGWVYWAFSLAATIVLHDAYFYWTHRLLHHRRLFTTLHHLHHESHSPSPWAAYAFSPGESVVQAAFLTLLIFVLPVHLTVVYLFMAHMIIRNVVGHSGFELFPRFVPGHRVFGHLTTVTHHDMHHSARQPGNYGLYFTWWDRLMGTEHSDYMETVTRVMATPPTEEAKADIPAPPPLPIIK